MVSILEAPSTWRARFQYLLPPGTGHWALAISSQLAAYNFSCKS
jgi:hypothetical protein